MNTPHWKLLPRIVAGIAGVTFVAGCGLWVYFAHHRPAALDVAASRVYRLVYHRASVYLTRSEAVLLASLFAIAFVAFVAGIVLDLRSRRKRPGS